MRVEKINSQQNFKGLYVNYKNGGAPLVDFSPNMYLTEASLEQWIKMIKKQPILF